MVFIRVSTGIILLCEKDKRVPKNIKIVNKYFIIIICQF
ncbi:MAG: hypothetical protein ACI93N_002149 [Flavobacteriaceae bacterium]|jgi:hypothetical protein